MNDAIIKQAAALITGGSTFTQEEREEMARAILALVPVPDAEEIKRRVTAVLDDWTIEDGSWGAFNTCVDEVVAALTEETK